MTKWEINSLQKQMKHPNKNEILAFVFVGVFFAQKSSVYAVL